MIKKSKVYFGLLFLMILAGCGPRREQETTEKPLVESSGKSDYVDPNASIVPDTATSSTPTEAISEDELSIPEYSGEPYVVINGDTPFFTDDELTTECYTDYGSLDELGRAGVSIAVTCKEELPEEDPESDIGDIKPSGWHQNKYEGVIDSTPPYLYNRSHLLMNRIYGTDSDVKENLITGTRNFNVNGMLPNEMEVLNFIQSSDMKVIYRVTPIYDGNNLLANGVLMEAMSVEDRGESLSLCRYAYNVQDGVEIDYATGENWLSE